MVKGLYMQYPSVSKRYFAAVIDVFVILGIFYIASESPVASLAKANIFVVYAIVFLYEPVFTSKLCTLGQFMMGYRVRTLGDYKRIGVFQALSRYIIKIPLGIISMLTIPARRDRRAIHDLVTSTIVVSNKALEGQTSQAMASSDN